MTDAPPRRLRRILLFLAGAAALLVVVAAVYVSTPRGFQRAWLPLARWALDAEIRAASGRLDLRGRLEVRELQLESEDLAVELAHGVAEISPWAFPPWRRPLVEWLELESGHVTLRPDAGPEEEAPEEEAPGTDGGLPPALRPLPVRIERASLRDVTVESRAPEAAEPAWHLAIEEARVFDVRPGEQGVVSVRSTWHAPGAGEAFREGRVQLDVTLREPAPDAPQAAGDAGTPDRPVAVDLRADLAAGPGAGAPPRVTALAGGRGALTGLGHLRLDAVKVDVEERGEPLATLRTEGTLALAEARADLDVEVDAAPAGPLLAWIPLPDAVRGILDASDAALRARVERADTLAVDGSVRFEGLEAEGLPPSLDLAAKLELQETQVALQEVRLRGLAADGSERERARLEGRVGIAAGVETELDIEGQGVPVTPWLARFGPELPPSGALPLDAALQLRLGGDPSFVLDGDGTVRVAAAAHPDLEEDAVFALRPRLEEPEPGVWALALEGEGPGSEAGGTGRLEGTLRWDGRGERAALALEASLRDLDATALVPRSPQEPERSAEELAEEAAETETAEATDDPEDDGGPRFSVPLDLDVAVELASTRVRNLRVGSAQLDARSSAPPELDFAFQGDDLAGGTVDVQLDRAAEGEEATARWSVRVKGVALTPLLEAVGAEDGSVSGFLDLESEGEGRAPLAEAGALASGNGFLQFHLKDARAEGLRVQKVAAARAGLSQFLSLELDEAQGRLPIEEGSLRLDGVQVHGKVVHFRIDGRVSPEQIDLAVNPRLGPDLAAGSGLQNLLFAPVSSLVALPFVVTVKGALAEPGIGLRPATPALLGDVVGLAAGAVQGGAGLILGEGEEGAPQPGAEGPPSVGAGRPPPPGIQTGPSSLPPEMRPSSQDPAGDPAVDAPDGAAPPQGAESGDDGEGS